MQSLFDYILWKFSPNDGDMQNFKCLRFPVSSQLDLKVKHFCVFFISCVMKKNIFKIFNFGYFLRAQKSKCKAEIWQGCSWISAKMIYAINFSEWCSNNVKMSLEREGYFLTLDIIELRLWTQNSGQPSCSYVIWIAHIMNYSLNITNLSNCSTFGSQVDSSGDVDLGFFQRNGQDLLPLLQRSEGQP